VINRVIEIKPDISIGEKILGLYHNLLDFWPSILAFIGMIYFTLSKKRYYFLTKQAVSTNY
jgi:hypothetical protein